MKKIVTLFFICLFFWAPALTNAQSLSAEDKARLQVEYDQLQKEIEQWQKILDDTKAKKNTLQGDVTALNAQIAKAEKEIKQRNITVTTLNKEINQKIANISSLENRLENDRELLANLLKKKNQNEVEPIFYLLLSSNDLSNLIVDIDSIGLVNKGLQDLFAELRSTKIETQKEKEDLDLKKNKELDAKYEVEQKKKVIAQNEAEKKSLLNTTAKAESSYQLVLADRQRRAEVIRSALFDLRDAGGISFAKALEYATYASGKTGVRVAFILAILSQESDLGKNIGSCYVSDLNTGDGVGKNTGRAFPGVMKSPRDTVPFETITKGLGLTWATTPVSCPSAGGYGGAMGPAQFIPSTWQGYATRLASIIGVSIANPWDPKTAITATALYMKDLGAAAGGYTAERTAALKYYAGGNWAKPANAFYGNQVIAKAEKFQNDIDFLKSI